MKLNALLAVTAAVYGVLGIALVFAPDELLAAVGSPQSAVPAFLAQMLGAALMGFAWMCWFQRYTKTEGILGRPVSMPNLLFATVAFWLALGAWRRHTELRVALAAAGVFGVLMVAYAARVFGRGRQPS